MTFVEQLVQKKKSGKDIVLLVGLWVLALLIATALLYFALGLTAQSGNSTPVALAILLAVGDFWLAFKLSGNLTVEYEYSAFEGELMIDKIVAKRKRTRIVQVAAKKIEQLSPIEARAEEQGKFDREVVAAPSKAEATWFVTYSGKKNGRTLVLFAPSDEFFAELYKDQTRDVKAECDEKRLRYGV